MSPLDKSTLVEVCTLITRGISPAYDESGIASPATRITIATMNEAPPAPPDEIAPKQDQLPTEFALQQNFPNPWNPVTQIKYSLSEDVHVTLKVYDVLGRMVSTLVEEDQPAGEKSVEFNGAAWPSGIYYYRLNAGHFTAMKKMVLLK